MQSNSIYDTEEAHNEIGQVIHDAKRRLLASHKSGVALADATKTFIAEVENVTSRAAVKLSAPPTRADERTEQRTESNVAQNLDVEKLRARAQSLIDDPTTKPGHSFHVGEILEAEKWDDLEEMLDAIEKGHSYEDVLARNDQRTLSDDQVEALCFQLANRLEGEHLAGYFFALIDHVSAQGQGYNAETVVDGIKKLFLAHNAHGSDAAMEMLRVAALANLREQDAEKGGDV